MTSPEDKRSDSGESPSFAREVGAGLKQEVRCWFRWALWGAGIGAIAFGALGAWYWGVGGFAYGAAIGGVAAGVAALIFYLYASISL